MERRVTPPKRVTSPTRGPPPPCKQALSLDCSTCSYVNFFLACCGQNCERPRSRHDNVVCFCFDISFLRCPCLRMLKIWTQQWHAFEGSRMVKMLRWTRVWRNSDTWSSRQCSRRIVLWIVYWSFKMVAKEANHPKTGFFEAVFRALRENTGAMDDQLKKYLEVLLGDKDHEKVLESIATADKAMRISSPPATRRFSYYRGAGRVNRSSVQCYYCYQFPCCPEGGLRPFPRSGWVTPVGLLHLSVVGGHSVISHLRLLSPGRGLRLYFLIWGISVLILFLPFPFS